MHPKIEFFSNVHQISREYYSFDYKMEFNRWINVEIERKRRFFCTQDPFSDFWDDGCIRVDAVVFVAETLYNYCCYAKTCVSVELIRQIWCIFVKCSSMVTRFNECRVLAACIVLTLKWCDDTQFFTTQIIRRLLPNIICTRVAKSYMLACMERYIFFNVLNAHVFEVK